MRIFRTRPLPRMLARVFAAMFAISLSPAPALAEIDLGQWQTHAAMAEQGAVCGAFADQMTMQGLVDEKVGHQWAERRAHSASVIRRAVELEGRNDVDGGAIDVLFNRYSMWLLNNLANAANAEILDPTARDAARNMIGDVCAGLYAQADQAILKSEGHQSARKAGHGQAAAVDIDELKAANNQLHDKVASLQQKLAGHTEASRRADSKLRDLQERHDDAIARIAVLNTELATAKASMPPSRSDGDVTEQNFVVQLGAFSSRAGALSEVGRIQAGFPDNSDLAGLTITSSPRQDGTSIFRITTSEMMSEEAQRLCGQLWANMVSCMLRAVP